MKSNRLEAFSDGVLAIVITIMVLEFEAPEQTSFHAVLSKSPVFISYLVSFIYVGIYWNNHHHLFQITEKINGKILWANLHLLFWLSLIPFTTSWLRENYRSKAPATLYGIVLLMCGIAYYILQRAILKYHGQDFALRKAIGRDMKGKISVVIYLAAIGVSLFTPKLAQVAYVIVAVIWFVPDSRIERYMQSK